MGIFKKLTSIFILFVTFTASAVHSAKTQERSINFTNSALNNSAIQAYEQQLQTLKTTLASIAIQIGEIKDCHSQRLIYTSTGCRNPLSPENDPSKASHADISKPLNTCPTGHAHVWNNVNWSCKELRRQVSSGVPADSGTWQVLNAESCSDLFGRRCRGSDDTCPTAGNPIAVACSLGSPNCRYTFENATSLIEFVCR